MSDALDAVRSLLDAERAGALATIVDGPDSGRHGAFDADGSMLAGDLPGGVAGAIQQHVAQMVDRDKAGIIEVAGGQVFVDPIVPRLRLIVFGAVHIAEALAEMANRVGFRVLVADPRPAFVDPARFPGAERVISGWPEAVIAEVGPIGRITYVVVLSHDERVEGPLLPVLLQSDARYIGAMGSRRTHAARLDRLAAAGFDPEDLARIHGPIGLDIGAHDPAEVAVAILAEMIATRRLDPGP